MTLDESNKVFNALKDCRLIWPGSSIVIKDPSLSRVAEEYIEVYANVNNKKV